MPKLVTTLREFILKMLFFFFNKVQFLQIALRPHEGIFFFFRHKIDYHPLLPTLVKTIMQLKLIEKNDLH